MAGTLEVLQSHKILTKWLESYGAKVETLVSERTTNFMKAKVEISNRIAKDVRFFTGKGQVIAAQSEEAFLRSMAYRAKSGEDDEEGAGSESEHEQAMAGPSSPRTPTPRTPRVAMGSLASSLPARPKTASRATNSPLAPRATISTVKAGNRVPRSGNIVGLYTLGYPVSDVYTNGVLQCPTLSSQQKDAQGGKSQEANVDETVCGAS
ncbi:uncharacterized protein BKCO1_10000147 [Diplodia corticola]|uniref:Uncharacterized protein n=1 Tax=Diplodia corticola TaxID=236234 RepID=A0A1J9R7Z5_9PEZI|nr:uncharacterized protein BKCO1_10000147 [Diplodia corticola]OJD36641.1 hypothetical protein BKCO1_10000147 [Diplodia corticola]